MLICPRCGGKNFWRLATGQRRCGQCGLTRKFDKTYWNSAKMSPYWKGRLLEYFCLGVPAYRLRHQVPLDLKTVQRWFRILRIAIYELMREPGTPGPVIIDEAVELAKRFGEADSPAFVNGILDTILHSVRGEPEKR